jgi:hypothetical protein
MKYPDWKLIGFFIAALVATALFFGQSRETFINQLMQRNAELENLKLRTESLVNGENIDLATKITFKNLGFDIVLPDSILEKLGRRF